MKPIGIIGIVLAIGGAITGAYLYFKPKTGTGSEPGSGTTQTPEETAKATANETSYNNMIKQGDSYFNQASTATVDKQVALLNNAINRYNQALSLKPNDATAKAKIAEAEDNKPSALDSARVRLIAVINAYKMNGKFLNTSDAEFLILNLESLEEADKPTVGDIKAVLKASNMAFYDGKVTLRMTKDDVLGIISNFALKNSNFTPPLYAIAGEYDSPNLSSFPSYQLKKMLAHGWWFGFDISQGATINPTPTTRGRYNGVTRISINGGGSYAQIFPFNRIGANDTKAYVGVGVSPNVNTVETTLNLLQISGADSYVSDYYLEFAGNKNKNKNKVRSFNGDIITTGSLKNPIF